MKEVINYLLVAVMSCAILFELLRLLKLLINPAFLQHSRFDFPISKPSKIIYHLSLILILLVAILLKLKLL